MLMAATKRGMVRPRRSRVDGMHVKWKVEEKLPFLLHPRVEARNPRLMIIDETCPAMPCAAAAVAPSSFFLFTFSCFICGFLFVLLVGARPHLLG